MRYFKATDEFGTEPVWFRSEDDEKVEMYAGSGSWHPVPIDLPLIAWAYDAPEATFQGVDETDLPAGALG